MIYPSVLIGAGVVMRPDVGVDLLNVIVRWQFAFSGCSQVEVEYSEKKKWL